MNAHIKRRYPIIMMPQVFKLALPSLLLLFSFKPGIGREEPKSSSIRKEIKVEGDFQNIRLDGNISVILTNEPAGSVTIEGKGKHLEKVSHTLKNDTLFIDDHRKFNFSKLTIYLSAIHLDAIQVNGDTNISSNDFIKSEHLHISLNGNISVKVKTMGKLSFDTPADIELSNKAAVKSH